MDTTFHTSRLRYLDADDIDDPSINFDGLDVRGADGRKLGDLDGFIVDPPSGRVYYAVVDSGGWFTSRRLLLPIGHARLNRERRALDVDVTQDTLRRYPEFDADRFRQFTDDEMRAFEQRMAVVCCPEDRLTPDAIVQYDRLRHYSQPEWWKRDYYREERARDLARATDRDVRRERVEPARETFDREHVTARERPVDAGDISPHDAGRAQPGDVLGIETGGERSYLGDESADENKRRRDAERAAGTVDRDRRD